MIAFFNTIKDKKGRTSLLFHGTGYGVIDISYRKVDSDFKNNYPEWWQIFFHLMFSNRLVSL